MPRCFRLILLSLLLILYASACDAAPSDSAAVDESGLQLTQGEAKSPVLAVGEPLRLSGDESLLSEPFRLEGAGVLNVYYRQDCEEFILAMKHTNPDIAEAPFGNVVFAAWREPAESTESDPYNLPFEYIPGEYQFDIQANGSCTWDVWAVVTHPEEQ